MILPECFALVHTQIIFYVVAKLLYSILPVTCGQWANPAQIIVKKIFMGNYLISNMFPW